MFRILLALFVALIPDVASACSCAKVKGPFIPRDHRGVVATGRVVTIHSPGLRAEVEITEGFLNATAGTRINIYNLFATCAYPFREGEEYVLVTQDVRGTSPLWKPPPGSQASFLCSPIAVLNSPEGKKMLAAIREEMRRRR